MRDGWSRSTVGALVENLDARRVPVKKSDRRPGPYPYYGASGVVDYVDGYLFDGEFLLVAEDGENLNTRKTPVAFLASGKFWVNNHAHILRGMEDVDTRFLAYFLEATDINGYITGSAQPKLSQGNLNAIPVALPTLDEREGIVRVLRTLDDKIETNRALNETLEATCQTLFRSWFVDFDPVVAKSEGRRPPHLTDEVAALFPDRLEDSPIGPVPAGWTPRVLPECFEINPPRRLSRGEVAPYLDMKNMPTHAALPLEWAERGFGSGLRFANGDTLVARITPCLENGKTAFVKFLDDGKVGWGSTEYIVLRSRLPLPEEYSYFLARTDDFRGHSIANMTGSSGRQRVPTSCYDKYLVPSPDARVAKVFGDAASPALTQMHANILQSRTLATLRDALLPRLLSGELRVRAAEKLVEGAV